ncbi:MAG: MBL fold metallo-hydrolase [Candidatus Eisenbacteria bacterium]
MRFDARLRFVGLLVIVACFILGGCAEKDTSVFEPDTTAPWVPSASESNGRVSWTTNEDATCVLLYGTRTGVYDHHGYHVSDGGRSHYVDLIDVGPTEYRMRIVATDRAGNTSTGDEMIFLVEETPETENLVYTMVDVGWGDCHFLEFPGGTNVIVDAGYGNLGDFPHSNDVFGFLDTRGVPRPAGIDYMIATHNHGDHYGGFLNLLGFYTNTTLLTPAMPYSRVLETLGAKLAEAGVPVDSLIEGQTNANTDFLRWDEEHGVRVKVFSAGAGRLFAPEQDGDPTNCDSPVIKVSYGQVDIMLNADAEAFVEQRMLKTYGSELDCDVLKVGHHANNDASSEEFLAVATPRVGLIPNSLEENPGVFDQSVINLLREYNVDYFVSDRAYRNAGRTDEAQDGHVSVTTDGETFTVWTWK